MRRIHRFSIMRLGADFGRKRVVKGGGTLQVVRTQMTYPIMAIPLVY